MLHSVIVSGGVFVLLLLLLGIGESRAECPFAPLGVVVRKTARGETFTATAFVRPLKDDEGGVTAARTEARIAARLLLKRDSRVPRGSDNRLLGVVDAGSCIEEGRVYFTVSLDAKTVAQAIELRQALQDSVGRHPALVPSFSWIENERHEPISAQVRELLGN